MQRNLQRFLVPMYFKKTIYLYPIMVGNDAYQGRSIFAFFRVFSIITTESASRYKLWD